MKCLCAMWELTIRRRYVLFGSNVPEDRNYFATGGSLNPACEQTTQDDRRISAWLGLNAVRQGG